MSQTAKEQKNSSTKKKDGGQNSAPSTSNAKGKGLESKVKEVKDITNWPDEEITRVLEKHNYDTQITIEAIVDGREGNPGWTEVAKKVKQESKPKTTPNDGRRFERGERGGDRGDRGDKGDGSRRPRKSDGPQRFSGEDGDRRGGDRRPQKHFTDSPNSARGPRRGPPAVNGSPVAHGQHGPGAHGSQAQHGQVAPGSQAQHAQAQLHPQTQPVRPPAQQATPVSVSPPVASVPASTVPPGPRPMYSKVLQSSLAQPQQHPHPPQQLPPQQPQQAPQQHPEQPKTDSPSSAPRQGYAQAAIRSAWKPKETSVGATQPPVAPAPSSVTVAPTPAVPTHTPSTVPIAAHAASPAPAPAPVPIPAPSTAPVAVVVPTPAPIPLPAAVTPTTQPQVKAYTQPIQAPTQTYTPPAKRHSQFEGPLLLPQRSLGVDVNLTSYQFGSLNLGGSKKEDTEQASHAQTTPVTQQHQLQHSAQQIQQEARPHAHTVHLDPNQPHHILSNPEDLHSQIPTYPYPYPGYIVPPPMTHFPTYATEPDGDPRLRQPLSYYDPTYPAYPRAGSPAAAVPEAQKFPKNYNSNTAQSSYRDTSKFTQQEGAQGTQSSLSQQTAAPQSPPPQSPPQYPPPGTNYYYPYHLQQYSYQNQSQFPPYPTSYYKPAAYNFPGTGYPARPHSTNTQGQSYIGEEEYKNMYLQHPYSQFYVPATHDAANIQQAIPGTGKAPNQLASSPPNTTAKQTSAAFSTTPSTSEYNKGSSTEYKYGQQQQQHTASTRTDSYYNGQPQYAQQQFMGQPFTLGNMVIGVPQQQGAGTGSYHGGPAQQAAGATQAPTATTQQQGGGRSAYNQSSLS